MRYAPGAEATFLAEYVSADGPVNASSIYVDIINPLNEKAVDGGEPTSVGIGGYSFSFTVPEEGPTGLWRIEWHATVQGSQTYGEEDFEVSNVSDPGVGITEEILIARLRARIGEVGDLPDHSDTMFDNAQILDILFYADNDLDVATHEGWKRKAARLARLIDIGESGSDRSLSQRFRQAKAMLDYWGALLSERGLIHSEAIAGRVVGRVIAWGREEDPNPGTPFSGYSEHIRAYPTHRLLIPAIMG